MPDISMCKAEDCPKSPSCYRFNATPTTQGQLYFYGLKYDEDGCEYYWPYKESDDGQKTYRNSAGVLIVIDESESIGW